MKLLRFTAVLITSAGLLGCASGALVENMAYKETKNQYTEEMQDNMSVDSVTGGKKTNPAWTSEIDNESFAEAVKQSLEFQGLYSNSGNYALAIKMLKVDQPMFGLDMKVTTHIQYTLTEKKSNKVVFDETVVAPYTATVGDAFAGIKRLRLANEGSAKKNIEGLLKKLSELNISPSNISITP